MLTCKQVDFVVLLLRYGINLMMIVRTTEEIASSKYYLLDMRYFTLEIDSALTVIRFMNDPYRSYNYF
jgi:hypothetical protein